MTAALAAAALARSSPASANGGRVVNAVACTPEFSEPSITYSYFSGVLVPSDYTDFACAIDRRVPGNLAGLAQLQVAVSADDTGYGVWCDAYSFDQYENILLSVYREVAGQNTLVDFGGALNVSALNGHYDLTCNIAGQPDEPRPNRLYSIYYDEPGTPGRTKVANARVCMPLDPHAYGWEYMLGGLMNQGAASPKVACGIERKNALSTGGLTSLKVKVSDRSGQLTCTAKSFDRFGVVKDSSTKKIPSAQDYQVIDFGNAINVSTSKGFMVVFCDVPVGGEIHSLSYQEP